MRPLRSFIRLVASIGNEFFARNGPYMAAAVSFYALFSMFPLMLALIAVAGFFLESESFRDRLIEGIPEVLPVEEAVRIQQSVTGTLVITLFRLKANC